MARETRLIPDLYFPDEDQELQASSVEGEGGRGQGGGLEGGKTVDLTPEGFIPIHKLTLEDLPEPIRDEEHFQYIMGVSKNVVKINNIGLSSKRPDDDEFKKSKQKALCGSGYLLIDRNRSIVITTNRHVLFNEEELLKSTFDVFYEDDQKDPAEEGKKKMKLFKRTARRSGKYFVGKFSKDDIAQAVYQVTSTMEAHIKEHYFKDDVSERIKLYQHRDALDLDWTADPNTLPVVCLISHPLGQPKQVSFGEMVRYDLPSRIVYHTAPSKPGSSGGLLVVFQGIMLVSDIFHVGTDLLNGKKYRYARVQYKEISPLDMGDSIVDDREEYISPENQSLDTSDENYVAKAGAFLEIASLAPFAPIFGAFLLRAEDKILAGLDKSALKPCKTPLANEPPASQGLKQSVKDIIQKLAKVAPSLILGHSESSSDACDLVPFLESQGPCYCQSIVKMMERGVKLEDGTVTECFLSPYTATAKMSSDFDVTWPWSNRSNFDPGNDDAGECCLLQECLKHGDEDIIPAMMIVLIAKANMSLKGMCSQTDDASLSTTSDDCERQGKTVNAKATQVHPSKEENEQAPWEVKDPLHLAQEKELNSSTADKGNWLHLAEDILTFLFFTLNVMIKRMSIGISCKCQQLLPWSGEESYLPILYTRGLALIEHAFQHERQVHPDSKPGGQGDSSGNWCQCGRPGLAEVLRASISLENRTQTTTENESSVDKFREGHAIQQTLESKQGSCVDFISFIVMTPASPFSDDQAVLKMLDAFLHGRNSLMLFLASGEALLYNFCLLAKHISKLLQPLYFAFPVSVFGRPGNWPGNVTPPEVQRTAWRLIQDAIRASGFCPAVLTALEKDAERQRKLIDLYVDMKQLKWRGRIQPSLFAKYQFEACFDQADWTHGYHPLCDATYYFVWYATFLVYPNFVGNSFRVSMLRSDVK